MADTMAGQPPIIDKVRRDGPVSRQRKHRMLILYAILFLGGLALWLMQRSPFWRVAGLGLWFPGAGFLATGGWSLIGVPVTLALFAGALFVWFASGMVIAPPVVWLGAALIAGAVADAPVWQGAPLAAVALLVAWRVRAVVKQHKKGAAEQKKRDARNAYLPQAIIEVAARAVPHTAPDEMELSADDVAMSRLILQRSLQPAGVFRHFDRIDQFQTSALRYQLNFLGYGLGQMQALYTPNFHGYLSEAQRRLIDQYLQRPVWDYWRAENLWGNLKFDRNPVGKDNIMLTGYLGTQIGLYMLNTGDMRYAEPGSVTFRWNDRVAYEHDIHTITNSVLWNFTNSPFCLYPCEPNWIYTGCNFRGVMNLAVYDRLFGTSHLRDIAQPFLDHFDREFTTPAGSVISLRSSLTGATAPFPGGDAGAVQAMNLLSKERAQRYWAMARNDMKPLIRPDDGVPKLRIPGKGLDFGNYGRGFTGIYGGLLMHAREIGDAEFSDALFNSLESDCGRRYDDGVLSYAGSNLSNATAFVGRLSRRDGWRTCLMEGPPAGALNGPLLTEARFPDVLVAKARSDGTDLDLVLYPGAQAGSQSITLERLKRNHAYSVRGLQPQNFVSDANGKATLRVHIDGRTALRVVPD